MFRYDDTDFEIVSRVHKLAGEHSASPAQIALAWLLHKPGVVAPIVGASKSGHIQDSVKALEIELTTEEMDYLEAPYQPYPVIGHS
jgi:aryl-alcohol dehydrogenase (NADP+)